MALVTTMIMFTFNIYTNTMFTFTIKNVLLFKITENYNLQFIANLMKIFQSLNKSLNTITRRR